MRFERNARALEKDDPARPVVIGGVAVIRVVEPRKIRRHTDGVSPGVDIFEHPRLPNALLAFPVRPIVVQVAELAKQRALPDTGPSDDRDAHAARSLWLL